MLLSVSAVTYGNIECAGLNPTEFNLLSNCSPNMFFCSQCQPKIIVNFQHTEGIHHMNININKRLQKVETEFTGMYSKINSQLKAIEEKINKDISKANTAPPPVDPVTTPFNSVESIASSLANEQKEREKRKLNVIVHNVAESDASSGLARKQEDISKLQTLFKDYMQNYSQH